MAKNHFLAQRKNGSFSVVPAGTRPIVIVGHFLDGPDGPTKFSWRRSKIKGTYYSEVGRAQTAKNRGEPQKMTPGLETKIFSGLSQWGSCSPGYTGDMPC